MGVYHIIPLGFSPGAATSALAYVKKKIEEEDKEFFGDSSMRISGIVLFTTREIRNGEAENKFTDNEYYSDKGKVKNEPIFKTVCDFIEDELGDMLYEEKGKIYFCESRLDNIGANVINLAKALLELSPRGKTGKNLWVNVTGGNNLVTASLTLASFLSGQVGRIYYTFIPHGKERFLRPTSPDAFTWIWVPSLKIGFDREYYEILEELQTCGGWINDEDLLGMLKQRRPSYSRLPLESFRREALNKLHGQGIIERRDHENRLSPLGRDLLEFLGLEILKALATLGEEGKFDSSLEVIKKF
jgi:hypothetical protein